MSLQFEAYSQVIGDLAKEFGLTADQAGAVAGFLGEAKALDPVTFSLFEAERTRRVDEKLSKLHARLEIYQVQLVSEPDPDLGGKFHLEWFTQSDEIDDLPSLLTWLGEAMAGREPAPMGFTYRVRKHGDPDFVLAARPDTDTDGLWPRDDASDIKS